MTSEHQSTFSLLLGIWAHLSRRRRIQLGLLLVWMLASGVAELMSLGAVLPFLAVLSEPERLWGNPVVQDLAALLGFTSASQLLLPVTLAFAVVSVLAALIRVTNLWLNGRLAAAVGSDLSCEAYRRTLYQSYGTHVQRNSASVISGITAQINQTGAALNALLQLLTSAVVAVGLLTGLLLIDAPVALAAAALFVCFYSLLAITSRRELRINGQKIASSSILRIKALQEGLGAIRDVLLDGSQPTYLKIYRQADRLQRQLAAKNKFIGVFPRYSIEALGMVAIAFFGGIMVLQRGSSAVIPLLGALALGAQRLLPALQQMYAAWVSLKGYNASIQAVLDMLNQPMPPQVSVAEPLWLRDSISLVGVNFRYVPNQADVLQDLDLEIRRGERIGLIGGTGSGKSTLVDLMMGLLQPTAGCLFVDGADLHDPAHPERLAAWRAAIAHVPQSIYLADSSIAENIAFGIPAKLIDFDRVRAVARQAQIADYVESISQGYATFVGERGVRLSGGQRQRIGIARALYKRASVLILDEATSSLDTPTEEQVMKAIEGLSEEITVVMIAHRLSTLANCDRVFELSPKSPIRITTPTELFQSNSSDAAIN